MNDQYNQPHNPARPAFIPEEPTNNFMQNPYEPAAEETVTADPPEEQTPNLEQKEEKAESEFSKLPPLSFNQKPSNVRITRPTTSPGKANTPETVILPSASSSSTNELLTRLPNFGEGVSQADVEWGQTYMQSVISTPVNGALEDSLSREGSDWQQGLEINGEKLYSTIPRFKMPENARLEGQQAIQMAMSHMQLGDIFHAGMYHSGFWVTFKPAPEPVWLKINRLLGMKVMDISRETYGLLHSTATALTVSTIINAILPYVYTTTVNPNEMKIDEIPKYLSNLDEHDFIWGFIVANYPQGFNLERSCIMDPSECRHVIKEVLNIRECQIVDRQALPEFAQQHMRNRGTGSMSLKSVLEYQDRVAQASDEVVDLEGTGGNVVKITFSIPVSLKKSRMADAYIDDVNRDILTVVTKDASANEREALYDEMSKATEIRFYQHWVKQIQIGTNTIDKEEDIAATLSAWTRDSKLRVQFFEGIAKFIDKSSYSVIGLEAAKCPACGADHSRPEQALRGRIDCIPIDIIQLFSNLAEFKARLIAAR